MIPKINIGGRVIGENESCFIVAEVGVNHNGSLKIARKLIDVAKNAGADAVKFQIFKAEKIAIKTASKAEYQKKTTDSKESQFDMLKQLELKESDFKSLSAYAEKKRLIFLSTPFDKESVDMLESLNVPAVKIPSGEITNLPLLRYIAKKGKPIILSTGMATLEEIGEAVEIIRVYTDELILLHCVTSYPARIEDMNLRAMETLRNSFKLPLGLSDHSLGMTIPIAAVALGAVIIEKHFTLDRNLPGPDHKASLEPNELREMVTAIRDVEKALGNGIKKPTKEEEEIKKVVRKSIVARVNIPKGSVIIEDLLDAKRPATAISPKFWDKVINRRAKVPIKKDSALKWEMLE